MPLLSRARLKQGDVMQNPGPTGPPIRSEFADDPDMLELVEEFVAELPTRMATLREAFESGEVEPVTRLMHQLAGASGGYGFPALGDVARRLENQVKSLDQASQLQSLREEVDALVAMCGRVVA